MFVVVIWTLWFEKNRVKFNTGQPSLTQIEEVIELRFGEWIKCFVPKFP